MKLKNKKTGEIKEFVLFDGQELQGGATLESLTKEWEDYKEPKSNEVVYLTPNKKCVIIEYKTKEEAEQAVEKLKAWKRLKDNGVNFSEQLYALDLNGGICLRVYRNGYKKLDDDINIIFGGEDE